MFFFLGIIALVGIMVNDGLVFVTTHNNHLEMGMEQGQSFVPNRDESFQGNFPYHSNYGFRIGSNHCR
ncbi:MAG: hypothetical protein R2769_09255 [Saprospiraceae bacterium]